MNQTEAQQFLNDNGPWNIKLDGSKFVFENIHGVVFTVENFIDAPFIGVPGVLVTDYYYVVIGGRL